MTPLGLYVHIPFCARKCAYCDFVSFPGKADRIPAYLDRLAREMFAFFKPWPMYREITEIMEGLWTEGSIMQIYQ